MKLLQSVPISLLLLSLLSYRVNGALLEECQGDCEVDSDCADGLVCFQREVGDPIPGCTGNDASTSNDYCVRSGIPYGQIDKVGNNGEPADRYPLGLCEGDCDGLDSECEADLICFQRGRNQAIPGCSGGEDDDSKTDYCVHEGHSGGVIGNGIDTSKPPANGGLWEKKPCVEFSTIPQSKIYGELNQKNGDKTCNTNDCNKGCCRNYNWLLCDTKNDYPYVECICNENTADPDSFAPAAPTNNFFPPVPAPSPVKQPEVKEIEKVGNNGLPRDVYPLKRCQGDCDSDSRCAGNLKCFEREPGEAVPGCSGGIDDNSRTDYCIAPYVCVTPETPGIAEMIQNSQTDAKCKSEPTTCDGCCRVTGEYLICDENYEYTEFACLCFP